MLCFHLLGVVRMARSAVFDLVRVVAVTVSVGFYASSAPAADEFATLFDEEFEGVALHLVDPDEVPAPRPRAADHGPVSLPGFPLTAAELSLVSRMTDPVAAAALAADGKVVQPSLRERLLHWLNKNSAKTRNSSVFSALVREADEPGVRVDIDADAEEVRVEYRVGF